MMLRACALALLAVILGAVLSELGFKSKKLFSVLGALLIISLLGENVSGLIGRLCAFSEMAGIGDAAKCALKVVGLGYVFGFTADVCRELGEGGVASAVGIVGRVETFLVVMPYFEKTLELGAGLLK